MIPRLRAAGTIFANLRQDIPADYFRGILFLQKVRGGCRLTVTLSEGLHWAALFEI